MIFHFPHSNFHNINFPLSFRDEIDPSCPFFLYFSTLSLFLLLSNISFPLSVLSFSNSVLLFSQPLSLIFPSFPSFTPIFPSISLLPTRSPISRSFPYAVEPPVSDRPNADLVVVYERWSLIIEPQEASSERSGYIYFMEDKLLHAISKLHHV